MMLASIVREIREQARLAVLGAAVLGLMLPAVLYYGRLQGQTLLGDTYQATTFIAFCSGGLAMGLALLLGDLRRGHFGFAVHRPMPRWKLFVAKFIAGTLLYVAATSVALIATTACAANSRFVHAPFDWPFLLPSIFGQFLGVMWLATGMLIAARSARWVGSRLFPAGFTLFVSVIIFAVAIHFYEAAAIAVVATVLIVIAGAAYFACNGDFARQPGWTRPISGATVLPGAVGVLVLLTLAVTETCRSFSAPPAYGNSQTYLLDSDGNVYVGIYGRYAAQSIQDLAGHKLSKEAADAVRRGSSRVVQTGYDVLPPPGASRSQRLQAERFLDRRNYLQTILNPISGWIFVSTRRTLERYDTDGTYLGCLAPDGSFGPARVPFPEPLRFVITGRNTWPTLTGRHRAYTLSLADQRVRLAIQTDAAEPLLGVTLADTRRPAADDDMTSDSLDAAAPFLRVVALTSDRTIVAPFGGAGPWQSIRTPSKDILNYRTVAVLNDGFAMLGMYYYDGHMLVTFRGGVERRETLPDLPVFRWSMPWVDKAPALIAPLPLTVMGHWIDGSPLEAWVVVLPVIGMAVALGLTVWITRRRELGRGPTIAWLVMAALFGVHGPLTLLCLRERPVRIPCPTCGRRRPVDRDRCPHCDAAWPVPGDPATDVFEDDRAAA